tara:strand:- start:189 stop:374 length:186 start_codon:yes stop_codon:yes gene_type:complete
MKDSVVRFWWCKMNNDGVKERGVFENWLDEHNHKMELLRTITSAVAAMAGVAVFLKVFGLI